MPAGQEPFPDPCNLIVNYIPTPVTDAELHAIFSQYGELVSARVIVDRTTGHPKGYGFVKFKNVADANRAMMNMTGFTILGKRLKVTPARGFQSASIDTYVNRTHFVAPPVAMMPVAPLMYPGQPIMAPPPMNVQQFAVHEEYATAAPGYEWVNGVVYSGPSFEMVHSQYGMPSPPLSVEHTNTNTAVHSVGVIPAPPPSF